MLSPTSIHLTWVAPCHTQQYHIYYRGTCGTLVDEGRLDTDHQEHTFDGLQEGTNYSFTVTQTGFSGGRVLSAGTVYARTFTAGKQFNQHCNEYIVFSKQLNGNFSKQISKSLYLQKQIGYPTCGAGRGIQWNKSVVARCAIIRKQATSYSLYCNLVAEV